MEDNIVLNEKQKYVKDKAVEWFLSYWRGENYLDDNIFFPIAGYAGTGKSTLISYIVDEIEEKLGENLNIKFVAYTGKAALVMRGKGHKATTLHKLIKIPDEEYNEKTGSYDLIFRNRNERERHELNREIDLVIIDEGSMIPDYMIKDLKRDYSGIRFIVLGDTAQLPPINSRGNSIFLDISDDMILDKVHRQISGNPILGVANMIRKYKKIGDIFEKNLKVISIRGFNNYLAKFKRDGKGIFIKNGEANFDQVIVRYNTTRQDINRSIRKYLGRGKTSFQGKSRYLPEDGDSLLCFQNNSKKVAESSSGENYFLVNGMVGKCVGDARDIVLRGKDNKDNDIITFRIDFKVRYNDEDLLFKNVLVRQGLFEDWHQNKYKNGNYMVYGGERVNYFGFGNCITAHKAQGSEWDTVAVKNEVIPYDNWIKWNSHKKWFKDWVFSMESKEEVMDKVWKQYRHECRGWLYTSVTRAKKNLLLAVDQDKMYGYKKKQGDLELRRFLLKYSDLYK